MTWLGSGAWLAVAVLPALGGHHRHGIPAPRHALAAGFRTAALISGGLCRPGGRACLAAVTIVNPPQGPPASRDAPRPEECMHCGLEAPPLTTSVSPGNWYVGGER